MSHDEREVYYNELREAAIPVAKQLQRVMQVHLEPHRVVDADLAYCWAAIATAFIERDPRYALSAIKEVKHIERTTLRILVDSAIWFAVYPNDNLKAQLQDQPIFDAGIIAKSVQGTLAVDNLRESTRNEVGDPSCWKFHFAEQAPIESKHPQLDLKKLHAPWAGGRNAGPSIKAVCFILDVSGSMAGTRMSRTLANMLMVFDKYIGAADSVSYIEFNTRVTVKVKMSTKSDMHRRAMENARAGGGTNFYDAMMAGIQQLDDAPQNRKKYIIALTDGANGRSSCSVADVCSTLIRNPDVTPFIIGAGGDIPQEDVRIMQKMVGEVPKVDSIGGMYVKAERTEDLEAAFESVVTAMNHAEIEKL